MDAVEGAGDASRIVGVGNYTLIAMVVGIVAIAVGDELAIANPHDPITLATAALIFGGPAIFLLAQLALHASRRPVGCRARDGLPAWPCSSSAWRPLPLGLSAAVIASSAVLAAVAASDTRAEPSPSPGQAGERILNR